MGFKLAPANLLGGAAMKYSMRQQAITGAVLQHGLGKLFWDCSVSEGWRMNICKNHFW